MNKTLKKGLYLHSYIALFSAAIGETVYVIYDDIGEVFSTTNELHLERFYAA